LLDIGAYIGEAMANRAKGIGKKLAIYVPKEDEYVVEELNKIVDSQIRLGFRTSFSFELVKSLKAGLASGGLNMEAIKKAWYAKIGKAL
jgi:hypothetical protein